MAWFSDSRIISGARVSRFLAVKSFESFTPSCASAGRFSCFMSTPAITSGPITHPLPASSMPAISILRVFPLVVCGYLGSELYGFHVVCLVFYSPKGEITFKSETDRDTPFTNKIPLS